MIRVVLDTNVVVSAFLTEGGLEAKVLRLVLTGRLALYVSEPMLAEYEGVLRREKFRADPDRKEYFLSQLRETCIQVQPRQMLTVSSDPADNQFLECAEAGKADFLVTGNKRHFPKQWRKTKVVNAREFLEMIESEIEAGSR
jgi:putative PIN family toxin of toxin-antitoxin system